MSKKTHLLIPQLLNQSLRAHQAGRLGEAAAGYQEILKKNPQHSDALHLLGVVAQQSEKYGAAIDLIKAAIAQNSSIAAYHHNLGNSYSKNCQFKEAVESYRKALRLNPKYFEAHYGMGNALAQLGELEVAAEAYAKAIEIQPSFAEGHFHRGRMLGKLNLLDQAIESYLRAIQLDPKHSEYFFNLGNAFHGCERDNEAIEAYLHSLQLRPNDAECLNNLGLALGAAERLKEAEQVFLQALAQNPLYWECFNNLGKLMAKQKRWKDAVACYRQAVTINPSSEGPLFNLGVAQLECEEYSGAEESFLAALKIAPDLPEVEYNLGNVYRAQYRIHESIACYRKALAIDIPDLRFRALNNLAISLNEADKKEEAIQAYQDAVQLKPEDPNVHRNLGYLLMSIGRLQEGFAEHEWRWKSPAHTPRSFEHPLWMGEPIEGQTILLHSEQGFGDTLQFVRYVPLVAERGAKVILDVQLRLKRVLEGFPGADWVTANGDPLPDFTWHCPLMSLPLALKTTMDTIPSPEPYLKVPAEAVAASRARWPEQGLRVGLVWAGSKIHPNDAARSLPLRSLLPLSSVPGVTFYSLQTGDAAAEINEVSSEIKVLDVCSGYTDFSETAAFVAGLDLVITVDTAVAHLAGALGVPLWVMLSHSRLDWRWFFDREDSPWYACAKLYRQPKPGDWQAVVGRMTVELRALAERHAAKLQPARMAVES